MEGLEGKVFMDGEFYPASDAHISVYDRSFLYGDGVFETLRTYGNKIFLLDRHLERLRVSAGSIRLEMPWSKEWLKDAAIKTVSKNVSSKDLLLRITVSRGTQIGGMLPEESIKPTIVMMTREIDEAVLKATWKAIIPSTIRNDKRAINPIAKSANFLNNILAGLESRDRGADEAIMLNNENKVTEGTISNVFIVKDGDIITPPVTDGLLIGITREQVIKLALGQGIRVVEKSIERDDLYAADEMFLTLSSQGIVPVTDIDGYKISVGQVTEKLIADFHQMINETYT